MSATTGLGVSGPKNKNDVLFISCLNNNDTINDNITKVFINLDADMEIFLPDPKKSCGKIISFLTRETHGNTITLNHVYGIDYGFDASNSCLSIISNGKEWVVCGLYQE